MTIGLRLFISSMTFSIVIALAYYAAAHEIVGTFMLGFMAFAMSVIAGYMIVAEHEARLVGDNKNALIAENGDERIGSYSLRSPLPFWTALALSTILLGLVIEPTIAGLGCIALLVLGAFYIIQS